VKENCFISVKENCFISVKENFGSFLFC
jgi:hypothetical protein